MKNVPHLTFLRSFEAAARHLSFTSAAEELNCTQSAVSNHIRSLEEFIGRPLFVRHPRSLTLTEVGEAYLPSIRHALQEIDVATDSLISISHKREVVVSCPISLAESWLPQVMQDFNILHPDIILTVHGTVWTDVEPKISDISITINHLDDVNGDAVKLWNEKLSLVCAPSYQVCGVALSDPVQLDDANLIHILGRPVYWELIAKHFGLGKLGLKAGFQTNISNLALEMAVKNIGCAVMPQSLVKPYLERGLLYEPFAFDISSPWTYFADFKEKSATPSVKLFKNWLLKAAAEMDV